MLGANAVSIGWNRSRMYCIVGSVVCTNLLHAEWQAGDASTVSRCDAALSIVGDPLGGDWVLTATGPLVFQLFYYDGLSGAEALMFDGLVDQISLDRYRKIVSIEVRDYSGLLMNDVFQGAFVNQTSSEVASSVANRYQFAAVIAPTERLVGAYYSENHSKLVLDRYASCTNEWSLLNSLAALEQFEFYLTGKTLVFSPLSVLSPGCVSIDTTQLLGFRIRQSLFPYNVSGVVVKSWNSWDGKAYVASASQSANGGAATAVAQTDGAVVLLRSNLSDAGVETMAQNLNGALSQNAMVVDISMPGETLLRPRDTITVIGDGLGFNIPYSVKSIRRRFSPTEGFTQRVMATTSELSLSN